MLTYGDGLSDQNIRKLVKFHQKNKKIATMTIVRPPVRFGEVKIKNDIVKSFRENLKSQAVGSMEVFSYSIVKFLI